MSFSFVLQRRYIIQGVATEVHGEVASFWLPEDSRRTTIIIIGKKLSAELIRESFRKICGEHDVHEHKEGVCNQPNCDASCHVHSASNVKEIREVTSSSDSPRKLRSRKKSI